MKKMNFLALILPLLVLSGCGKTIPKYYKITFISKDGTTYKYFPKAVYPTLTGWDLSIPSEEADKYSPTLAPVTADATYYVKDFLITIIDNVTGSVVAQKNYAKGDTPKSSDFNLYDEQFVGGKPYFVPVTQSKTYYINKYRVAISNIPGSSDAVNYFSYNEQISFENFGYSNGRYLGDDNMVEICTHNQDYTWRHRVTFHNVQNNYGSVLSDHYGYTDIYGTATYFGTGSSTNFNCWDRYDESYIYQGSLYGFYDSLVIYSDQIWYAVYN